MAQLKSIWTSMITRNVSNAGTDSSIVLIVDQQSIDFVFDNFEPTSQEDQSAGKANLYKMDVKPGIDPDLLTDSSIRIAIRGDDSWKPHEFFIWGETTSGSVEPLAFDTQLKYALSTDSTEGNFSAALTRAYGPNAPKVKGATAPFTHLLVLMTTASAHDSGTSDKLTLSVKNGKSVYVNSVLNAKNQSNHGTAQANFYEIPVMEVFSKNQLHADSITLSISGSDAWTPSNFFVFGYVQIGATNVFTPLVNLPKWTLKSLSTDTSEGEASVILPLI